jgi:hypothetical protein
VTRIAPIRYYKGRVAYPSAAQLRAARATWDFDDVRRPTVDVDCAHVQRIEAVGSTPPEARRLSERKLARFFDYVGCRPGFRVLSQEETPESEQTTAVSHEIVYVIESRPTRGHVRLTLRSEQPRTGTAEAVSEAFGSEALDRVARMFDWRPGQG